MMISILGAVLFLWSGLIGSAAGREPSSQAGGTPVAASVAVRQGTVSVERETYLMGTLLRAEVQAADRAAGLAAIERAFARIAHLEDLLSTWREDAELSRLNRAPVGEPVPASAEILDLLREARRWRDETGGAFDPGLGALVDAWDMRGAGRRPSRAELASARAASGLDLFELDAARGTVRRAREASWIDSGAFGKGAGLRSARDVLLGLGIRSALLDFGGQVLAIGGSQGGSDWSAAVAHPSRRQQPVAAIRLADASASTSGQSERAVEVDGCRLGHILDPRSGLPVPAWGSVTVVAADPLAADALSTALFVLGSEAALRWARERDDVGVLVLVETADGLKAGWNGALAARGIELAPGVARLAALNDPGTSNAEGTFPAAPECALPGGRSAPESHPLRPDPPYPQERG
jgi:FAD:protein FMN transferase